MEYLVSSVQSRYCLVTQGKSWSYLHRDGNTHCRGENAPLEIRVDKGRNHHSVVVGKKPRVNSKVSEDLAKWLKVQRAQISS